MEETDKKQPSSEETKLQQNKRRMSPFGHLFRFFGWWFGFTGLYSMFAVCPFCGQQGCPVGLASAGTVGAFLALCVQDWKLFFRFLRNRLSKEKKEETSSNKAMHSDGNSAKLHSRR
jgi:hypothetical protein